MDYAQSENELAGSAMVPEKDQESNCMIWHSAVKEEGLSSLLLIY